MKKLIFLLASAYFLAAQPVSIKTEYDSSVSVYPQIEMQAQRYGEDAILLKWATKVEDQILGFDIQRKTRDGEYQSLGFVPAFADLQGHEYEYVDAVKASEQPVYRLRVIFQSPGAEALVSPEFVPRGLLP